MASLASLCYTLVLLVRKAGAESEQGSQLQMHEQRDFPLWDKFNNWDEALHYCHFTESVRVDVHFYIFLASK